MKLGFIGVGNMGSALMKGILRSGYLASENVNIFDTNAEAAKAFESDLGVCAYTCVHEMVKASDIIVMAVKPYIVESVLGELGADLEGKAILNIAVTWTYEKYKAVLKTNTRVLYAMVNTPCGICEGATLLENVTDFTEEEYAFAENLFKAIGTCGTIETRLAGIAGSINGCTPAFAQMFIESLADAAVYYGMNYKTAITLAAQAVAGAAKTAVETQTHPSILKNNVCSPGGTTIRGVRALEEGAFRATVINAVAATLHDQK